MMFGRTTTSCFVAVGLVAFANTGYASDPVARTDSGRIANVQEFEAEGIPSMEDWLASGSCHDAPDVDDPCAFIESLELTCDLDGRRLRATVISDLPRCIRLRLVADDAFYRDAKVRGNGRARARWWNPMPGEHEVCIADCGICTTTMCGCATDADCDDGLFCNGFESCDAITGDCLLGSDTCAPDQFLCDEENDRCVECFDDHDCPPDTFCRLSDNACVNCPVNTACGVRYYGVVGHGSQLYEFDPSNNWSAALVGDTGIDNINAADFSPDGKLFVVGKENVIWVLAEIDPSNGSLVGSIPLPEPTEAIAFDETGLVWYVSNYNQIKAFDPETGNVWTAPNSIGHGEVQGIDFGPDGALFGISSYFGAHQFNTILEIDTTTGEGVRMCDSSVLDLNSLNIDVDGNMHAITSSPGHVYRIDDITVDPCVVTSVGSTDRPYGGLASGQP